MQELFLNSIRRLHWGLMNFLKKIDDKIKVCVEAGLVCGCEEMSDVIIDQVVQHGRRGSE